MAELGSLSAWYESGGLGAGTISSGYGDPGGKSYGTYQLSSNAGSLQEYVNWLNDNGWWFGANLSQYALTTDEFDAAWKWLADPANGNAEDFARSQHEYIKYAYYDPAIATLAANYYNVEDATKHHEVMKDVVWSRSVQYGPGLILEMFTTAVNSIGYPNLSYVDALQFDEAMIKAIYLNVCHTPEWATASLRDSLYARFESECNDAIARL